MSQSDRFDEFNNENEGQNNTSDTYTTESSADIYNTPDVSDGMPKDAPAGDTPAADVVVESVPVEDGAVTDVVVDNTPEEEIIETDAVVPYGNPYNNPNNPYDNSPYSNQNNPYGSSPYNNQSNPYGSNPYNNDPYGNNPYNNNPYNDNPYNDNQNNNNQYNNNQNNNQYNNSNNPYGNDPYNNNQYNSNPYGNGPSGNPPYNNNQFSPYAVPPKKKSTGLIIGIVVAVAVLFLIAFCALIYRAVTLYNEDNGRARDNRRDDYRFDDDDDDWGVNRNRRDRDRDRDEDDYDPDDDYDDYDYDYDYDDWYDDWYDDYDYDDSEYYDFHDDVKYNLSYSVDFEYYDYETDNNNVYIYVDYPIIEGDDVPNLDKLNDAIWAEVQYFTDYYEDEYADYMTDDDDYFIAYAEGYVTYMDEEKMSVVFQEEISSSYYDYAYVYCINIDMEHGVILDNENILSIDDDFSTDFRERSEVQNPNSKTYLSYMTDKEMTGYFNSSDIIVFYTPMGMEIGFNYDTDYSHGWVTVTYQEYEQYLKVF